MELPAKKDKAAYNEKVLRENSILIHQDLLRHKIKEGTW
jgi:hypothetical protein